MAMEKLERLELENQMLREEVERLKKQIEIHEVCEQFETQRLFKIHKERQQNANCKGKRETKYDPTRLGSLLTSTDRSNDGVARVNCGNGNNTESEVLVDASRHTI